MSKGRYKEVIDLFESLSQYQLPRTFDYGVLVIEALAKDGRLSDACRSIAALKMPIMNSIHQIERVYSLNPDDILQQEKLLSKKSKYLLVHCQCCLAQLTYLTQTAPSIDSPGMQDGDHGKMKATKEELVNSVLFCIDMILRTYGHDTW